MSFIMWFICMLCVAVILSACKKRCSLWWKTSIKCVYVYVYYMYMYVYCSLCKAYTWEERERVWHQKGQQSISLACYFMWRKNERETTYYLLGLWLGRSKRGGEGERERGGVMLYFLSKLCLIIIIGTKSIPQHKLLFSHHCVCVCVHIPHVHFYIVSVIIYFM